MTGGGGNASHAFVRVASAPPPPIMFGMSGGSPVGNSPTPPPAANDVKPAANDAKPAATDSKAAPARAPLFSAAAWSPLKVELFRSLYIATSIAQIGTWIREAGGPWLMKLLTDGRADQPRMVALV